MSFALLDTALALLEENYQLQRQIYAEEFGGGDIENQQSDLMLCYVIETLAAEKQMLTGKLAYLKENKLPLIE